MSAGEPVDDDRTPPTWEAPPIWAPVAGHISVAFLKMPLVVLICFASTRILGFANPALSAIIGGTILLTAVNICVTVATERPFVLRRRSSVPGGWGFALAPWLAGAISAFALAGVLLPGPASLALASAMTVVEAVELAWSRAWRPGDTDAEFHEKWVAFRELTKETFAPDVADVRHRLDERAMDGYRRKIAEREAQRARHEEQEPDEGDRSPRDA
ncbi:hypothetical protein [Clavibacter nebraskensis]|uniref:Integral membrane protein n=2 Tax=Clavibacter nebraskensis TaxID=31963 RepID=A0A399QF37_9MICO|nr:hypothetical protein [Clavibacter nebraskensis]KXU21608.1 hypothetical protein VV38_02660 [Clavibacter nebraskensis]OAH18345.1 hypothetical protein A3Q38_11930 [Clavibacter nebraskensis]QGV68688.1 hypothetical protein EGX37_03000 [Clavibacter nebraskensis]QGV71479.1 hypothetical protein EGX35_03000 [Clavibacter nebraskensis]RIJ16262.1 hypothetical protein DZF97_04365 [Clavibacter nebraskensis]